MRLGPPAGAAFVTVKSRRNPYLDGTLRRNVLVISTVPSPERHLKEMASSDWLVSSHVAPAGTSPTRCSSAFVPPDAGAATCTCSGKYAGAGPVRTMSIGLPSISNCAPLSVRLASAPPPREAAGRGAPVGRPPPRRLVRRRRPPPRPRLGRPRRGGRGRRRGRGRLRLRGRRLLRRRGGRRLGREQQHPRQVHGGDDANRQEQPFALIFHAYLFTGSKPPLQNG